MFRLCPDVSVKGIREEALKNIQEAIELYLEPVDDDLHFSEQAELLEVAL